jgi:glyoxylase-like metal-dependent hydrolase (beta-lactamase superfamily II)
MSSTLAATLRFPVPVPPDLGQPVEIAPGILWLRLALPFALNHVNIYLIEDGAGWAILDTGINDARSRAWWEQVLAGPLRDRRPTRLIATHFHPDHVGLAGWLAEKCQIELVMSRTEYLGTQFHRRWAEPAEVAAHTAFYAACGLDEAAIGAMLERDIGYRWLTTDLPPSYRRIAAGDHLTIGGRRFEVLTGGGHSPELVMLLCRAENLFLAADQVLAKISPNVSVWPHEPDSDPLGDYLRSLAELGAAVAEDAFVLPAHNLPFHGLHARIAELTRHHDQRCQDILDTCAAAPLLPAQIVPLLFPRKLDAHQTSFAFGEAMAHVNYMLRRGWMLSEPGEDGRRRVRPA